MRPDDPTDDIGKTWNMDTGTPDPEGSPAGQLVKQRIRARLFAEPPAAVKIGRFSLLDRIGAGAMGEVYAAYDDNLDRKVAIKLVMPWARAGDARERLLREAKTLAQLSHPNVVQVYDGGEHGEKVFIAMEFVRGQTLTTWLADAAELPEDERRRAVLGKFIEAGRGLLAAHEAGLIHRDFKPDNALVGEDGRVRVVDFGLARLVRGVAGPDGEPGEAGQGEAGQREADEPPDGAATPDGAARPLADARTMPALATLTVAGAVVGTPAYMSPEQMAGGELDARADQFSFCVALYEALYGTRPFAGDDIASLRSAIETRTLAPPVTGARAPRAIRDALARGLAPDPADRWPDMAALLAALRPVEPRRRRALAIGLVAAVAAAGGGAFALSVSRDAADPCASATAALADVWTDEQAGRVRAALDASGAPYAAIVADRVVAGLDRYAGELRAGTTDACEATHVRRTQTEDQLGLRAICLERGARALRALVATFEQAGEPGNSPGGDPGGAAGDTARATLVERALDAVEALPSLAMCGDVETLALGVRPPATPALAADVDALRERIARAHAEELAGRFDAGAALAESALADARAVDYPPVRAEALYQAGRLRAARGALDDAVAALLDAADIAEANRHDELAAAAWARLTGPVAASLEQPERGRRWSRRARAALDRIAAGPAQRAELWMYLGNLDYIARDYPRAEARYRQAERLAGEVPESRLLLARVAENVANALEAQGRYESAAQAYERALTALRDLLGPHHPRVAGVLYNLGALEMTVGEFDGARARLGDALAIWRASHGDDHRDVGRVYLALSNLALAGGDVDAALDHAKHCLAIYERALPETHPARGDAASAVATIHYWRREYDAALAGYRAALAIRTRTLPAGHPDRIETALYLAQTLLDLARPADALAALRDTERELDGTGGDDATRALLLSVKGTALRAQGALAEAQASLERALAIRGGDGAEPAGSPNDVDLADVRWALADVLDARGREPCRALALATAALAVYTGLGDAYADRRAHIEALIARVRRRCPSGD